MTQALHIATTISLNSSTCSKYYSVFNATFAANLRHCAFYNYHYYFQITCSGINHFISWESDKSINNLLLIGPVLSGRNTTYVYHEVRTQRTCIWCPHVYIDAIYFTHEKRYIGTLNQQHVCNCLDFSFANRISCVIICWDIALSSWSHGDLLHMYNGVDNGGEL